MHIADSGKCFNVSSMLMGIEWIFEEEDSAYKTCGSVNRKQTHIGRHFQRMFF